MSKGYTKQEVQQWQQWSKSREELVSEDPPMVAWAKSKEESAKLVKEGIRSYEYELTLRSEDDEFIVDCREDVMEDGETISSEYEEGYIFDDYFEAEAQLNKRIKLCEEHNEKYSVTNEVKTYLTVLGRKIIREESEREESQVKEESTLWTVDLNTIFKNVLFDSVKGDSVKSVMSKSAKSVLYSMSVSVKFESVKIKSVKNVSSKFKSVTFKSVRVKSVIFKSPILNSDRSRSFKSAVITSVRFKSDKLKSVRL